MNTDENTINTHEDRNETNRDTGQELHDTCDDDQEFADDAGYCDTNLITDVLTAANKDENQFQQPEKEDDSE